MAMYWTCRYGANHDLGEKCDCREEEERAARMIPLVREKGTNQLAFDWQEEGRRNGKKTGCV